MTRGRATRRTSTGANNSALRNPAMTAPGTPAAAIRRRLGYTLIELMVVIMIVGMGAGVVAISWDAIIPGERLNSDVRALAARLHGTRSDAIARSAEFKIFYDLDHNRYWVQTPYRQGGGRAYEDDEKVIVEDTWLSGNAYDRDPAPSHVAIHSVTIDGVRHDHGVVYVRFDPLGASSDHYIVLRQALFDRYFTIEVLALTGVIKFHDGVFVREEAADSDFD